MTVKSSTLALLAESELRLSVLEDGSLEVCGTLKAHPDSILGTQNQAVLPLRGRLTRGPDNTVQVRLSLGQGVQASGQLQVTGFTPAQLLAIFGRSLPAAFTGSTR